MLNRREFLTATGVSAVGAALASVPRFSSLAAMPPAKPDLTLRIAPTTVEIAPGVVYQDAGLQRQSSRPAAAFPRRQTHHGGCAQRHRHAGNRALARAIRIVRSGRLRGGRNAGGRAAQ